MNTKASKQDKANKQDKPAAQANDNAPAFTVAVGESDESDNAICVKVNKREYRLQLVTTNASIRKRGLPASGQHAYHPAKAWGRVWNVCLAMLDKGEQLPNGKDADWTKFAALCETTVSNAPQEVSAFRSAFGLSRRNVPAAQA